MSVNEIIKKELDRYLENKIKNKNNKIILSWDESKDLLFEYCNLYKKIPNNNTNLYKGYNIKNWLDTQKKCINSQINDKYIKLSVNEIVKKELDHFLEIKYKNKDKKKYTWNEMKDILFEYCNLYKKKPISIEIYKNINIGNWLRNQIKKINDDIYKKLSENEILKKELDRYLTKKLLK